MLRLALVALVFIASLSVAFAQTPTPVKVRVNGVELHYIEAGAGDPIILLHGGTGDYRSLIGPFQTLAQKYHVISYSRRYHFPNDNRMVKNHSALIEAEDLAALIRKLNLGRVHLIGTSYGAFTALALALEHPDMVRSMVLAEPPLHTWMKGTQPYQDFMTNIWVPCVAAFRKGDKDAALRVFVDGLFGRGYFDRLPTSASSAIKENARAMEALALSSNPFPYLPKNKVKMLRTPTIIMTGANTVALHKAVDEELGRLLPNTKAITVPNAGHGIARDNPTVFISTVLEFLSEQK